MQQTEHLLNRIAFGGNPSEIKAVSELGPEKYFERQLHPDRIDDSALENRLTSLTTLRMTTAQLTENYGPRRAMLNPPRRLLEELQAQKLVRAVHSERQLQEVMTDFWFNHFNIYWDKGADRWLTTAFETHVVRPNALGKSRPSQSWDPKNTSSGNSTPIASTTVR